MSAKALTNGEVVELLGLPQTIITDLQTAEGTSFQAVANEFLSALFNKCIYQTVTSIDFTNPFKKYDSFPVRFGSTIENIFVELPKGYKYDKDATNPFDRVNPDIKTLYATINYEMQYETTVYDSLLRKACLDEYGFMNLISAIIGSLQKSKSIDEYFATIAMLNNANIYANGFEQVTKGATDAETASIITKKIIEVTSSMQLPKKTNNKTGVMNATPINDVLLIIKVDLLNSINLDYLAGVYNLSKVDLIKNIIAVDSFKVEQTGASGTSTMVGTDIDFVILDSKGFDNHVALEDGGLIYNPKGKYTNHFYNLWKIISFKQFYNARAFQLKVAA